MPTSLPPNTSDPLALADWLELTALEAGDKNSSAGDLSAALQLLAGGGNARAIDVMEDLEADVVDAIAEIEERQRHAGDHYPFELVRGRVVQAREDYADHFAYLFCLVLSYFGYSVRAGDPINPWHLFEDVALVAAKNFVSGEAVRFGALREGRTFAEAVDELCVLLGEGNKYRARHALNPQDDKLDLVAWRNFRDHRESKLILFGQCAAGANWTGKIAELQPQEWAEEWLYEMPVSPLVRSFYVPHRVPHNRWAYLSRRTGILFDRCRIAAWIPPSMYGTLAETCIAWVKEKVPTVGEET